jgi:hypothetical protein
MSFKIVLKTFLLIALLFKQTIAHTHLVDIRFCLRREVNTITIGNNGLKLKKHKDSFTLSLFPFFFFTKLQVLKNLTNKHKY